MERKPRLLATASGGGHWIQLLRLRRAFEGWDVAYVSMFHNYASFVPGTRYYTVPDASRFNKIGFIEVALRAAVILWYERPDAIITTGSAPMLCFLAFGRLMGVKTLWIDSVANAEKMSSSGRVAKKLATRTVSQCPNVSEIEGVECWGAVL